MKDPYLIAEIGSNWRKEDKPHDLTYAKKQIDEAKLAGVSAVKFQLFTAMELFGSAVRWTRFERDLNSWALHRDCIKDLALYCDEVGIDFLCSAFSTFGFKFVDPYVKMHKLASPEANHPTIVDWLTNFGKPVLYSNGCGSPAPDKLNDPALHIPLECMSKYPARVEDYSLDFRSKPLLWGLSDHTFGNELAVMARANGATFFEKHVDFFKHDGLKSPDACVSSDKEQFKSWVAAINDYVPAHEKSVAKRFYARVGNAEGWYRPIPDTADLTLT